MVRYAGSAPPNRGAQYRRARSAIACLANLPTAISATQSSEAPPVVLMLLPSYAPELNSVENIWDYLRSNFLSHCVWDTYEAILDACCDAWNALMAKSEVIASIGTRE